MDNFFKISSLINYFSLSLSVIFLYQIDLFRRFLFYLVISFFNFINFILFRPYILYLFMLVLVRCLFSYSFKLLDRSFKENIRLSIIEPYRVDVSDAIDLLSRGRKLYAENPDEGRFFTLNLGVVPYLGHNVDYKYKTKGAENDINYFISNYGVSLYDSQAYEELINSGFTFVSVN